MWLFIYSWLKFSRTPEKRRNGEGADKTKRKEKDKKKGKVIMIAFC